VPLILLVVRAWFEYNHLEKKGIDFPYRWPLIFLIASSFWNFLGAGVFGFIINLPIVNYYEHATYLTSNHGHTALFGTYGMLSLGLVLFVWRTLLKKEAWSERSVKTSFYGLNIGLACMFLITLLLVGIAQLLSVMKNGFWYARSSEFYNGPLVQLLGNIRFVPDSIVILFGPIPLLFFLFLSVKGLKASSVSEGESIFKEGECPFSDLEKCPD
jgi:nitric oxide reductase subunit B